MSFSFNYIHPAFRYLLRPYPSILPLAKETEGLEFKTFVYGIVVDTEADAFARDFVATERFVLLHTEMLSVVLHCFKEVFVPMIRRASEPSIGKTSPILTIVQQYSCLKSFDFDNNSIILIMEQEQIKEYSEHDLIRIECMPSYESFRVMERFVESRPEHEQKSLYVALAKRHPFHEFRFNVERMGILQE